MLIILIIIIFSLEYQDNYNEDLPPEWLQMIDSMDYELGQSKVGSAMEQKDSDIATSLVSSFEAQNGRSGPVSTMANSMGLALPFSENKI